MNAADTAKALEYEAALRHYDPSGPCNALWERTKQAQILCALISDYTLAAVIGLRHFVFAELPEAWSAYSAALPWEPLAALAALDAAASNAGKSRALAAEIGRVARKHV